MFKSKGYIFDYVDYEIIKIKNHAKTDKIRLGKDNVRMCVWVFGYALNVVILYLMIMLFELAHERIMTSSIFGIQSYFSSFLGSYHFFWIMDA